LGLFLAGRGNGRLVTTGPFRVVRHPLYATWLWLIFPGIAVLCRSWLMLGVVPVGCAALKTFIGDEEEELDLRFGREYETYRREVNRIFPSILCKHRRRKMTRLPKEVKEAWDNREGAIILTTVDEKGTPNSIYATCVKRIAEDKFVVADNFFSKTRANILGGSTGSILYITAEGKAYQMKGPLAYYTDGAVFDGMKTWLDPKFPGIAATVLTVEAVYRGAEQLT